jgi:hypothetical protein
MNLPEELNEMIVSQLPAYKRYSLNTKYQKESEWLYNEQIKLFNFIVDQYDNYYNDAKVYGFDDINELIDYQWQQISILSVDDILFYNRLIQIMSRQNLLYGVHECYPQDNVALFHFLFTDNGLLFE